MSWEAIREAILEDAPGERLANLTLPDTMRAAVVRKSEVDLFAGVETQDKDPRKSLHVDEVPLPPLDWDVQRWCGSGLYPYK
jgi:crotonyl-CoA reductase